MSQITTPTKPISPLRRRMIEDMTVRGFGEKTQSDYIRHVKTSQRSSCPRSPPRRRRISARSNCSSARPALVRRR